MFYTGLSALSQANCVAVATSTAPTGPYVDRGPLSSGSLDASERPIGCGDNTGYGQIDPSVFVDPATGTPYLYISEDFACAPASASCTTANSTLQPTISVIPLAPDYLTATGPRMPLFSGSPGGWEAVNSAVPTVEGPSVTLHAGVYYLLYSGGNWRSNYGMGYATSTSPTGPFTKSANPILTQNASVSGPGGADSLVTGPHGERWLVYHGRDSSSGPRELRIDRLAWQAPAPAPGPDVPTIAGPTNLPQPSVP
jgi:beta-xylosidase